jgi:pyruvate dehydrogenase E2 component (dihydrolipoamide acetyltransferase)
LIGYLVAPGEPAPFEAAAPGSSAIDDDVARFPQSEASSQSESAAARPEHHPPGIKPRISPRARRAARELGMDVDGLRGSGMSGRVLERDILAAAASQARPALAQSSIPERDTVPAADVLELAITPIRRTIAERMVESARTTAGVTLTTSVDATNLGNLRHQFKAVAALGEPPAITVTDIIIKLTALALEKHPLLNARWSGEKIVVSSQINIGIAVDTEQGLLVPVVRDVPRRTLRQLAALSRELIDRARAGALTVGEMRGGTFTVTNLGPMGIEMFTPLINLPECAILGVGRIQKQVVVDDRQFVARDRMTLSLTFDHRIVDGAPAARFLQSLSTLIENPSPWLLN